MKKKSKTKIWLGVGAFVMAGSGAGATGIASMPPSTHTAETGATSAKSELLSTVQPSRILMAQAGGGEAGESGEGGEGKIDAAAVDSDAVEYGVALQVIAAHYHAGLLAYENKQQDAGAQMFAHGLAEVYVELEEVFKKRKVVGLGDKLNAAVDAATKKAPVAQVRKRVADVMMALAAAEKGAPKSDLPPLLVKTNLMVELLDRAAAQYRATANNTDLESYLDGLGFTAAARAQSKTVLPYLAKRLPKAAVAMKNSLDLAGQAYPGIKRPARKVDSGKFLASTSQTRLALSQLR
jgi:hypothetical protein